MSAAEAAIRGGADVIQLRDKELSVEKLIQEGKALRKLTSQTGVLLMINDRVDIALAVDADGVHLGQEDLPIETARRILGIDKLIGKSTHSLEQALAAQKEGVDYIGVGPIFTTPTKPSYSPVGLELIEKAAPVVRLPVFAIGGIDSTNVEEVLSRGARRIAVVRAVIGSDNIEQSAREFKKILFSHQLPVCQ